MSNTTTRRDGWPEIFDAMLFAAPMPDIRAECAEYAISRMLAAVAKENDARLAACPAPRHVFVCRYQLMDGVNQPHQCKHCGGIVSVEIADWYQRGFDHGMAQAERNTKQAR